MKPGAVYALVVLFAINLMNFFDRQIIGGIGEGIRREWGLSDTALGLLGTAFTLLYAVFGLPLGRLSDTRARRLTIALGRYAGVAGSATRGDMSGDQRRQQAREVQPQQRDDPRGPAQRLHPQQEGEGGRALTADVHGRQHDRLTRRGARARRGRLRDLGRGVCHWL